MLKPLGLAIVLCAPCMALAGQAMSLDDGFAMASNSSPIETVISPMQDGGGTTDAAHASGATRGTDDVDTHGQADNTSAARVVRPAHGSDAANPRTHKGHGKAPWQSLLPGAMK